MFHNLTSNKYVLYGGAIIALIGVFIILRNATGGGSSTVVAASTGPTDAQVQAQTQLALAQLQANTQANSDAGQLALAQLQVQAGLTAAQMQDDLQHYAIQQDSANTQAQINAQAQSDQTNAQLQATVAKWTLDQALAMQTSNNAFQLDYAQAANSTALAMQQVQAGVSMAQITSNQNVTIASLQSQAAQLASYLGAQVAITDSNNSANVAQAQIQANTSQHNSNNGLLGSVIGGVLGLFSDRRLKTDIEVVGYEADGMPVYSYRYFDSVTRHVGYMADQIAKFRPWALGPVVEGFQTVNYAAA